jgi:hypothetical protein
MEDVIGGDGMECAINPANANIQYGELYYGDLYRTTNAWNNSTNIVSGLTGNAWWVTPFVIDPTTPATLFIGYQDVFKSTNQGTSWTQISSWAGSTIRSIAVASSNPATSTLKHRLFYTKRQMAELHGQISHPD